MNGKPFGPEHQAIMDRMVGKPIKEIAMATGHSVATLRKRMQDAGLRSYGGRARWTRREWLLHDAAGLSVSED